MEIRHIRADEGPLLRDLCRRMLTDSPEAYEDTLEETESRPADFWEGRARRASDGRMSAIFVAEDGGECVGTATGFSVDDLAAWGMLAALWVKPECRRQGIGRALITAVEDWARANSIMQLRLWVADNNVAAKALYISSGFDVANVTRPIPSNPSVQEILMMRQF